VNAKPCPNCGKRFTSSNGLAGWAERHEHQELYECRNPSCSVYEYLEYPEDQLPDGGEDEGE